MADGSVSQSKESGQLAVSVGYSLALPAGDMEGTGHGADIRTSYYLLNKAIGIGGMTLNMGPVADISVYSLRFRGTNVASEFNEASGFGGTFGGTEGSLRGGGVLAIQSDSVGVEFFGVVGPSIAQGRVTSYYAVSGDYECWPEHGCRATPGTNYGARLSTVQPSNDFVDWSTFKAGAALSLGLAAVKGLSLHPAVGLQQGNVANSLFFDAAVRYAF